MRHTFLILLSLVILSNAPSSYANGLPFAIGLQPNSIDDYIKSLESDITSKQFKIVDAAFTGNPYGAGDSILQFQTEIFEKASQVPFNPIMYDVVDHLIKRLESLPAKSIAALGLGIQMADIYLYPWPVDSKTETMLTALFDTHLEKAKDGGNLGMLGSSLDVAMAKILKGLATNSPALCESLMKRFFENKNGVSGLARAMYDSKETNKIQLGILAVQLLKKLGKTEDLQNFISAANRDNKLLKSQEFQTALLTNTSDQDKVWAYANGDVSRLSEIKDLEAVILKLELSRQDKVLELAFKELVQLEAFGVLAEVVGRMDEFQINKFARDILFEDYQIYSKATEIETLTALKIALAIPDVVKRKKFLNAKFVKIRAMKISCTAVFN